jgi:hypothetical protein
MSSLNEFKDQPYLNLETYRRNGDALRTPVWFVRHADRLYIRTVAGSGKVKRVRREPKVRVALCRMDGEVTGGWAEARAREVLDDAALEALVDRLLDEKYGEIKRQMAERAARAGRRYTLLEVSA